jgi:hypothetical protein
VLVLGIGNTTRDTLASIVQMELLRVLANHNPIERKERSPREQDLEPNFEPESFKDQQEIKHRKNANKDIDKMAKHSNFHGKDNDP